MAKIMVNDIDDRIYECPECGEEIELGQCYCQNCGEPLEWKED